MGAALGAADEVVVLDVYVAREDPDPDVTGRLVADAVPLPAEHVHFVADLADAPAELVRLARPGDLVLTLGAGSVTDVGPLLLALLEDAHDHAAAQPSQAGRAAGPGDEVAPPVRPAPVAAPVAGLALRDRVGPARRPGRRAGSGSVFISSFLTVQQVTVQGESQLSQQQILAAARVPDGAHLAQLDLGAIRARVGALAPVRRVDVSRDWPHGVLIKVTERTPVAVVEIGGSFHAMDADGVLFRDYRRPPAGMPRVVSTADTGSAALAEAARVIASLPSGLAGRVDHVAVAGVDQVSLMMRGGAVVIWGSDAQSALKAAGAGAAARPARSHLRRLRKTSLSRTPALNTRE